MQRSTAKTIAERYSVVFIDAYGVLVDGSGVVPGAPEFIAELRAQKKPHYLLTNDASKLPETYLDRFGRMGLPLSADQILTSGGLLAGWFEHEGLAGARCLVLGPPDSEGYVERAKGVVLPRTETRPEDVEVIVVADEAGFPFVETLDFALTAAVTRLDRGRSLRLVCPNPDLIYPKGNGAIGVAAASIANLIQGVLDARFAEQDTARFTFLGKPHAPMFEAACARAGTRDAVMFGDQIATDIRGANRAGLTTALVRWGLVKNPPATSEPDDRPDFLVEAW